LIGEHKVDYQKYYLEPALAFIEDIEPQLHNISDKLNVLPKVNGSLKKIYRDVRFSKDKTPYKAHVGMMFWEGNDRKLSPGFHLYFGDQKIWIGGGTHMFTKDDLQSYRRAISDDKKRAKINTLLKKAKADGFELKEGKYKRLPRGMDKTLEGEPLTRHAGLHLSKVIKMSSANLDNLQAVVIEEFKKLAPFHNWLIAAVGN